MLLMKTVAFLCVANSARSQMAEGLARYLYGDRASFISAGSQPSQVNPLAIEVLGELGIDIGGHRSKSTDDIDFTGVDLVVTLCADEVCPLVPGQTKKQHWPFIDPANSLLGHDEQLELFRTTRDQIRKKLADLEHEGVLARPESLRELS